MQLGGRLVRAFLVNIITFLAGFGGLFLLYTRLGRGWLADAVYKTAAADTSSPFDVSNVQSSTSNIEAHFEAMSKMLFSHSAGVMFVGFFLACLWTLWWWARFGSVAGPVQARSGLRIWCFMVIVILISSAALLWNAFFVTTPGADLNNEGRLWLGLAFVLLPSLLFWFATAVTTPNALRPSVPMASRLA